MRFQIFLLIICMFFLVQLGHAQQVEVSAQVAQGFYTNPMGPGSVELKAWINFKNIGKQNVVFDKVNVYWFCTAGHFQQYTVPDAGDVFTLESGESREFYFATNGYTNDILNATREVNEGVRIGFQLLLNDRLILGNYDADVPSLEKLPIYLYRERGGKTFYQLRLYYSKPR